MYDRIRARIHALGMEDHIISMGARFPIEAWLAGCDFLIAPARDEGFGRTLVEAMLVGTPVIASNSGAHAEIIEQGVTGLLVPMDDAGAFASAVISLVDDQTKRKQIACAAEQRSRGRFSIRRHAKQVLDVYCNGDMGKVTFRARADPNCLGADRKREG